jgi:hypothetical protein
MGPHYKSVTMCADLIVWNAHPMRALSIKEPLLMGDPMRPRTSLFGASADAEVIWNAIAA